MDDNSPYFTPSVTMLRYPPTEIVLSPSDVDITMKRIAATKRANVAYLSRHVATNRARLSRPPIDYDSRSDDSTQIGDQTRAASSQSGSELDDQLARLAIRDDQLARLAVRDDQPEVTDLNAYEAELTSKAGPETDQENSEEAEMAVFITDPYTQVQLSHLYGGQAGGTGGQGQAVMNDTPPRSSRFARYLRPDSAPDN
jgi:hypothetical protein